MKIVSENEEGCRQVIVFETTGRRYAFSALPFFSPAGDGEIAIGYDDNAFDSCDPLTPTEKLEFSRYMMGEWATWAAATPSGIDIPRLVGEQARALMLSEGGGAELAEHMARATENFVGGRLRGGRWPLPRRAPGMPAELAEAAPRLINRLAAAVETVLEAAEKGEAWLEQDVEAAREMLKESEAWLEKVERAAGETGGTT